MTNYARLKILLLKYVFILLNTDETPLYCLCQQGEFGVMLGCDGDDCSIEWFHLQCVGLSRTPTTEKWLCPHCKDKEPSGTHTATCS